MLFLPLCRGGYINRGYHRLAVGLIAFVGLCVVVWGPLAKPLGVAASMAYNRQTPDTQHTVYTTTSFAGEQKGLGELHEEVKMLRKENQDLKREVGIVKKFAMQEVLAPEVRM